MEGGSLRQASSGTGGTSLQMGHCRQEGLTRSAQWTTIIFTTLPSQGTSTAMGDAGQLLLAIPIRAVNYRQGSIDNPDLCGQGWGWQLALPQQHGGLHIHMPRLTILSLP